MGQVPGLGGGEVDIAALSVGVGLDGCGFQGVVVHPHMVEVHTRQRLHTRLELVRQSGLVFPWLEYGRSALRGWLGFFLGVHKG